MRIRPAILIVEKNKILTMEYRYGQSLVYNLPGGNVEFNESLIDTLQREMMEELGITIEVGELLFVGEVYWEEKKQQTLHCIFQGKIIDGIPALNASETSASAIQWLEIDDLQGKNMYPNVGEAIQKFVLKQERELYLGRISQQWF